MERVNVSVDLEKKLFFLIGDIEVVKLDEKYFHRTEYGELEKGSDEMVLTLFYQRGIGGMIYSEGTKLNEYLAARELINNKQKGNLIVSTTTMEKGIDIPSVCLTGNMRATII